MASKNNIITVQGVDVRISSIHDDDYICLTDMLKHKDGEFFITDWIRNRNTLEFLSIWEKIHNPNFNYGEFAIIKSKSGLNSFKISIKEWVTTTNATGIYAKPGRYGGTFAHKDIAFEFGSWLSPEFKLFLIKEFQRLKEQENSKLSIEWDIRRSLTKTNYRIQTDAIKEHLIPAKLTKKQEGYIYANEADILNVCLFGKTAKQWKNETSGKGGNLRDNATVEQLVVLASLESQNALLIEQGVSKEKRLSILNELAIKQMKSLLNSPTINKLK